MYWECSLLLSKKARSGREVTSVSTKAEMLLEITMSKFGKTVLEIVERMISSVFYREVIQQYHLERGGLLDSILTMMAEHRSQSLRHAVRYQREQQRH